MKLGHGWLSKKRGGCDSIHPFYFSGNYPVYCMGRNSTRRFCARPAAVEFDAAGFEKP